MYGIVYVTVTSVEDCVEPSSVLLRSDVLSLSAGGSVACIDDCEGEDDANGTASTLSEVDEVASN